jgi:predicted dehydrogenase
MEAFMYRYGGKFRKMLEILESGVLGKIKAVQGSHGYTLDWASPAREDPALGGGSIYDVGCYVVDCMNAVAKSQGGKLLEAKAVTTGSPVDYHAAAALSYDCGILGVLESWFDAAQEQRVLIAGEKDELVYPENSKRFCEAAQKAGGDCQLILCQNGGHSFEAIDPTQPTDPAPLVLQNEIIKFAEALVP